MNEIMNFEHEAFGQVRTLNKEGEPWFVAKDVCDVLGFKNPSDATKYLDEDERTLIKNPSGNGGSRATIINESGLYSLILRSRKPEAKRFKKWVTSEVLPSIRKHGGYVQASIDESPEEIMARALLVAQRTIESIKEQKELAEAQLKADRPKVLFAESVEASEDSILVRDMAKLIQQATGYKTGGTRFYQWLRDNGYLIKGGSDKNMPTQYGMDLGLFEVVERGIHQYGDIKLMRTTKITGKGQTYFINKFMKLTRTQ
jgi:anti-repressor protein